MTTKTPDINKLVEMRNQLQSRFIERDDQITGTMCAILAKQHLFMVGPPGTAKSMLTDAVCQRIEGADYFQWLLTKFSTPEEIFGPISLKALENDEYKRITKNKLPEAHIAFLDEALDLNTPIPTPTGWTVNGEIKVGDKIFGATGKSVKVSNLTNIKENAECYELFFENGESIICDGGHNWNCRKSRGYHYNEFKPKTTKEMFESRKKSGGWQIPLAEPVELPESDLLIDPYVLGQWLGNGNSWTGEIYAREELANGILTEIQKTLPQARITHTHPISKKVKIISLADTGFRTKLVELGLILNRSKYIGSGKAILAKYLRGSIRQRIRLVQGLMDTEGYMSKGGTCTFSNTNESIIDGMIEVLRSLGIRCAKKPTKDKRIGKTGLHKPCWKVNFRADPNQNPFLIRNVGIIKKPVQRRHLKITTIQKVKSRAVRCITVDSPDHLFLAGKGMVVTHNCFKANSAILNSLLTLVNERKYHNNGTPQNVPLQSLFGASNELPEGEELGALYDRLLLRFVVPYIADDSDFKEMMLMDNEDPNAVTVSLSELATMQTEAMAVTIPEEVIDTIIQIKNNLEREGVVNSDRRFKQSLDILKAHAYLHNRAAVSDDDLSILQYILWSQLAEIKIVNRVIIGTANPIMNKILELMDQANEIAKDVQTILKDEPDQASTTGVEANTKLKKIGEQLQTHKETTIAQGSNPNKIDDAITIVEGMNEMVLDKCLGLKPKRR